MGSYLAQKTPNVHFSVSHNAGSMLGLSKSRQSQQKPSISVKEDLDDLLNEIDNCYSQVARNKTKTVHAASLSKDRRGRGETSILAKRTPYVDETELNIDDFISEIDDYLHDQKKE